MKGKTVILPGLESPVISYLDALCPPALNQATCDKCGHTIETGSATEICPGCEKVQFHFCIDGTNFQTPVME